MYATYNNDANDQQAHEERKRSDKSRTSTPRPQTPGRTDTPTQLLKEDDEEKKTKKKIELESKAKVEQATKSTIVDEISRAREQIKLTLEAAAVSNSY